MKLACSSAWGKTRTKNTSFSVPRTCVAASYNLSPSDPQGGCGHPCLTHDETEAQIHVPTTMYNWFIHFVHLKCVWTCVVHWWRPKAITRKSLVLLLEMLAIAPRIEATYHERKAAVQGHELSMSRHTGTLSFSGHTSSRKPPCLAAPVHEVNCLAVHTVHWTQGRQSAHWEAGMRRGELQDLQTRLCSPGSSHNIA